MREILITKLHGYIIQNNLDLIITLQQEGQVTSYLKDKGTTADDLIDELESEGKPSYVIEEQCLEYLTKDLWPPRFRYLLSVLEEEFEKEYQSFRESGIMTYEVINLIESCDPIFETLGFISDSEENRDLRYAVTGAIKEYLDNNK